MLTKEKSGASYNWDLPLALSRCSANYIYIYTHTHSGRWICLQYTVPEYIRILDKPERVGFFCRAWDGTKVLCMLGKHSTAELHLR